MRLLFDEMLSYKLPGLLADLYPDSAHIRHVGLVAAPDWPFWKHARDYDYIVTSEDRDYIALSDMYGFPPKLILVKLGNVPTSVVALALRDQYTDILAFNLDSGQAVYELSQHD